MALLGRPYERLNTAWMARLPASLLRAGNPGAMDITAAHPCTATLERPRCVGFRRFIFAVGNLRAGGEAVVPSPSNKYRDHRVCKNIKMTGCYHTILKFPKLGDLRFIYSFIFILTEQVPFLLSLREESVEIQNLRSASRQLPDTRRPMDKTRPRSCPDR